MTSFGAATVRLFCTASVALIVLGLAACVSFGPDQKKIGEVDAQVAEFNLNQAGEVIAEYSSGSGTSYAIYTHEIVLRAPGAVDRVSQLLLDADFELQPGNSFGATYVLRAKGRDFTAIVSIFKEVTNAGTETGSDDNAYRAEVGDVRVSIISSL